jgi:hypothetical protein
MTSPPHRRICTANPLLAHEVEDCHGEVHIHLSFKAMYIITLALLESTLPEGTDKFSLAELRHDTIQMAAFFGAIATRMAPEQIKQTFGNTLYQAFTILQDLGFDVSIGEIMLVEVPDDDPTPPTFQ